MNISRTITPKPASTRLSKAELIYRDGKYYLALEYIEEYESAVWKKIPDPIELTLSDNIKMATENDVWLDTVPLRRPTADFGLGSIPVPQTFSIRTELLYEKVHDMTIEEIEEALGYKINIVDRHSSENDEVMSNCECSPEATSHTVNTSFLEDYYKCDKT